MNLAELNSEFTILFEDLATGGSKGLDSYERSICFTYAQVGLLKQIIKSNNLVDIQHLVKFNTESTPLTTVYNTAFGFTQAANYLAVLDYLIKSVSENIPGVIRDKIAIDDMLMAAYKYPPKNLAYVVVGDNTDIVFPPFSFVITKFITKYIENPTPIILEQLTGLDSIDGIQAPTLPVLGENYHTELVNGAVQYAISVYIGQQEKEVGNDSRRNQ